MSIVQTIGKVDKFFYLQIGSLRNLLLLLGHFGLLRQTLYSFLNSTVKVQARILRDVSLLKMDDSAVRPMREWYHMLDIRALLH